MRALNKANHALFVDHICYVLTINSLSYPNSFILLLNTYQTMFGSRHCPISLGYRGKRKRI